MPKISRQSSLILFVSLILGIVNCHKHGAPNKSCHSLLPHHKHIKYTENSAKIEAFAVDGNEIEIEIQSEKPFKGKIFSV